MEIVGMAHCEIGIVQTEVEKQILTNTISWQLMPTVTPDANTLNLSQRRDHETKQVFF